MAIEMRVVPVRIDNTVHIAGRAVNTVTNAQGPLLSAEGCNLDDSRLSDFGVGVGDFRLCGRCNRPLQGDETP